MFKWLHAKKPLAQATPATKCLCEVPNGESVRIVGLRGVDADCQRLREMGFCEQAEIEKIADNGALICRVCNGKVIISQGLARNIWVTDRSAKGGSTMRIISLTELTEGQSAVIHDFLEESDTCARLEEMGLTPGEPLEVIRYAPLGDPVEIRIRGYLLSLRKEEARLIQVRV